MVMDALHWAYGQVLSGVPGTPSFEDFVASYVRDGSDLEGAINEMISWQCGNSGVVGFAANLGGILTLPVSIPTNLGTILFFQIRMVAAIARIRGYDPKSDQVKTLALACLVGGGVTELLKEAGVKVGTKVAEQTIRQVAGATLININKVVGFRLLTKFGEVGVINLSKFIPFIGGLIGGTVDVIATGSIGEAAKLVFKQIDGDGADKNTVV